MSAPAKFVAGYRLLYGGLAVAAIAAQYMKSTGHAAFQASNFFSYFTIQSNILAIAVFFAGAGLILARRQQPTWFAYVRGAIVVYMLTTALVYAVLLSHLTGQNDFSLGWADDIMHVIFPLIVAVDWLLVRPVHKITWRQSFYWLIFPLLWLAYTLERGHTTGWYPYPFLIPQHGYGVVALYCLVVAAVIVVLSLVVQAIPAHAPITRNKAGKVTHVKKPRKATAAKHDR